MQDEAKDAGSAGAAAGDGPAGAPPPDPAARARLWAALEELADRVAADVRAQVEAAHDRGGATPLAEIAGRGAGDTTFALDEGPEAVVRAWADEQAAAGPLSVLTEDAGWRHLGQELEAGPEPRGSRAGWDGPADAGDPSGPRELPGFDHGGPCVVVDPVDGTRGLMFDLRPAWVALAAVPPRDAGGPPRLGDAALGLLLELPTSRGGRAQRLRGWTGGWAPPDAAPPQAGDAPPAAGCLEDLMALPPGAERLASRPLAADADDRVDRGFLPVFRYHPHQRVTLARLEAALFDRLERHEGAHLRDVYDDQYTCNAGQLALLAQGRYRFCADLRAAVPRADGGPPVTSKPYDLAGAVVCARGAGAVVHGPDGADLDAPLDATTPVAWVGYPNAATAARIGPHLAAVLAELAGDGPG